MSFFLMLPMFVFAQTTGKTASGLIPCGISTAGAPVPLNQQCDFIDLINLVQNVLNFLIYDLATPIAVFMFAFAGFKLVTSGGDTNAEKAARSIFTNTLIGYAVMLSAFLIIKMVFGFFFDPSYSLLN